MSDHDVLAELRAASGAIFSRATAAESLCRLPDDTIKEMESAGFFRLFQPRRFGGGAADPGLFFECERELARACGSTGWVGGVLGINAWMLSLYDPQAQDDVWGADPHARVCCSIAPVGRVERVDGGYRISGRWSFASGSDHTTWAILGGLIRDESGKPVEMRHFLVPRPDFHVDPVWDTVGLRGTGSNDIVVDGAFVPPYRTITMQQMAAPTRPGHAANPEPLYRMPMGSMFTTAISVAIVGAAEQGYQAYLETTRDRVRANMTAVVEDPFAHVRIARAASDIDAAWLQLSRNIADLYEYAKDGTQPPISLRTRLRRDQVLATERSVGGIDLLMDNAGGSAMRAGDHVLQRAWRDVHTGRGHITNDPERALVLFGRDALGLDVADPML